MDATRNVRNVRTYFSTLFRPKTNDKSDTVDTETDTEDEDDSNGTSTTDGNSRTDEIPKTDSPDITSSGNEGYLKYAMCLQDTVPQMNSHKEALQTILKTYQPKISDIQFGSTVIFRAILTCILQYNILFDGWVTVSTPDTTQ